MFDLARLRLLRELSHRGTMTAVGQALGQTSSAVSQQLAVLEREAGVLLFERFGRRVRLTTAGVRLASHANTILQAVEVAHLDMRNATSRPGGRLVVASFASFAHARLVELIRHLQAQVPDLEILLQELEPPDAMDALREGKCDIAISCVYSLVPRQLPEGFLSHLIVDEPVLIALPMRYHDAPDPLDAEALAAENWIVGPGNSDDAVLAMAVCGNAGFTPNVTHGATDYALVQKMIAADLGIGLVPEMAIDASEQIVIRSLSQLRPRRRIDALTRASAVSSPNTELMLSALRLDRTVQ